MNVRLPEVPAELRAPADLAFVSGKWEGWTPRQMELPDLRWIKRHGDPVDRDIAAAYLALRKQAERAKNRRRFL